MNNITNEQWQNAQKDEIHHATSGELALWAFTAIVSQCFVVPTDYFADKTILEIGGGRYPLTGSIKTKKSVNIEPLWDKYPNEDKVWANKNKVISISTTLEELVVDKIYDEIWFFNILQHVIDPKSLLEKAKSCAKKIRVFEPINVPTDSMHLHVLTPETFTDVFPNLEYKIYNGSSIENFHSADCIYFEFNV
jgi:2-polyprenyl-3-methyl-5-hydroxy-6-metoxy-1,4-benzoquinol methylase